MGCCFSLPYGAATLDHFSNASRIVIPGVKNIFMMSDDPQWVRRERKKYYHSKRDKNGNLEDMIRIYTLPIRFVYIYIYMFLFGYIVFMNTIFIFY